MYFDITIVIGFLIITLAVGMGYGNSVKTIKDYALGGRNFSTAALVATIVATWASGSGFFTVMSKTYSEGLYYMFAAMGIGVSFLITALLLVPRMGEFLGSTSIAEAMGDLYGQKVRLITAIAGTIGAAGSIAVQFKVFGSLFSYFFSISGYIAIIAAGIIATVYSAFGGIRAVAFTDILQFFAFGVIIPLVGFIVWGQFYNEGLSLSEALTQPNFDFSILFDTANPKFLGMMVMVIYFVIPTFSAPAFQRIAIGNSIAQVKKAFLIAGIFLMLVQVAVAWIPFLVYSMDSSIPLSHLLPYIVDNYSYNGLKGLIIVAIIALSMSTADSRINAASVLFTNDICKIFVKDLKKEILISRLFAFFLGAGAIYFSLIETDLLGIIVLANSFYYPIVTPLFLLTVFGFRSSSKSVLIGIAAGFAVTIIWKILPIEFANVSQKMIGVLLAMLSNAVFLIGSHYLLGQPGGWVGIKDRRYLDEQKIEKKKRRAEFINSIINFNIAAFCKKIAPRDEITYTMLGIYFILCTFTTMYSTHVELLGSNSKLIIAIYQIMLVTSTVMAMYPLWPLSVSTEIKEKIVHIWWPISIFYMLIFFSSFFVMVSKFSMLQFVLFAINIMIAAILLGWRLAMLMFPLGFYLGVVLYKHSFGAYNFEVSFGSPEAILMYVVLIIGTNVIIFLKPNEEYLGVTEGRVNDLEEEVEYSKQEIADAKRVADQRQLELEEMSGMLSTIENGFEQEKDKLAAREVYLKDKVKLMKIEIAKLLDMKNEFLRNIPHESNTPLTGVISLSEVLYSHYDKLDKEKVKSTIRDIVRSSDRLKSYVNSITDLSKLESLKYDLDFKEIDLSKLIKERTVLYRKAFADVDVKQEFEFKFKDGIMVTCDEYYMTQALDHLISNAVNYGKGNPITITLEKTEDNQLHFAIKDQGIGIPKYELTEIFSKFKTSSKTKTQAGGRGLGLTLCEKIIEVHGGNIWAESDGVSETTLRFVIPVKQS